MYFFIFDRNVIVFYMFFQHYTGLNEHYRFDHFVKKVKFIDKYFFFFKTKSKGVILYLTCWLEFYKKQVWSTTFFSIGLFVTFLKGVFENI